MSLFVSIYQYFYISLYLYMYIFASVICMTFPLISTHYFSDPSKPSFTPCTLPNNIY